MKTPLLPWRKSGRIFESRRTELPTPTGPVTRDRSRLQRTGASYHPRTSPQPSSVSPPRCESVRLNGRPGSDTVKVVDRVSINRLLSRHGPSAGEGREADGNGRMSTADLIGHRENARDCPEERWERKARRSNWLESSWPRMLGSIDILGPCTQKAA